MCSCYLRGLGLPEGSGTKEVLRFSLEPSLTNFTAQTFVVAIDSLIGLGIDGMKKAPLYFMIKIRPPRYAP